LSITAKFLFIKISKNP